MKTKHMLILILFLILSLGASIVFAAKKPATQEDWIKLAESAAPPSIVKDALVMIPNVDGNLTVVKTGTNGIICFPDISITPVLDPICADEAGYMWIESFVRNDPKPANPIPGIVYMAMGGIHWEKDGKILMREEPGAKLVNEPPHWRLLWPFDPNATGLPTEPNSSGAYIIYAGTPYAHLIINQDPNKLATE